MWLWKWTVVCSSRRIIPAVLVLTIFALVLTAHGLMHIQSTNVGRPYETWDEIATYNTALVLSGPTASRVYRYGSLDTLLQWIGIEGYKYFDPVGRAYDNASYSNNVERSFTDSHLNLQPKTWAGVDYNYFRGLPDHTPIFISRQIHFGFVYLCTAVAGVTAVAIYGPVGGLALIPLLALLASPSMYFGTSQSLPNAVAAILGFICVFMAMASYDKGSIGYLAASGIAAALAANFKIDAILLGIAPAIALIQMLRERGYAFAIKAAIVSGVCFFAATFVSRPSMFVGPIVDLIERRRILASTLAEISGWGGFFQHRLSLSGELYERIKFFGSYLENNVIIRGVTARVALMLVVGAIAALGALILYRRSRSDRVLAVGVASSIGIWAFVVLSYTNVYDRFLMNGLAAFYATAGMFLVLSHRDEYRRVKYACVGFLVLLVVQFAYYSWGHAREAITIHRDYARAFGFDPSQNRTRASLVVLDLLKRVNGDVKLLIDQHAYFDVRLFRLSGANWEFINMYNVGQILGRQDPSKSYLVLFSKGTLDRSSIAQPEWAGDWTERQKDLYQSYQSKLFSLPVVRHFPGELQVILDPGPIHRNDDIYIAAAGDLASSNTLADLHP